MVIDVGVYVDVLGHIDVVSCVIADAVHEIGVVILAVVFCMCCCCCFLMWLTLLLVSL